MDRLCLGWSALIRKSDGQTVLCGLQLYLNLQCLVMKNDEKVLFDNFVEKSGGNFLFCRIFFYLTVDDFNGLYSKWLDIRIVHSLRLNIVCWKTWTQFRLNYQILVYRKKLSESNFGRFHFLGQDSFVNVLRGFLVNH